jgi:hypothetical protein
MADLDRNLCTLMAGLTSRCLKIFSHASQAAIRQAELGNLDRLPHTLSSSHSQLDLDPASNAEHLNGHKQSGNDPNNRNRTREDGRSLIRERVVEGEGVGEGDVS